MNFIKKFLLSGAVLFGLNAQGEIPNGYYDSCEGKCGQALLTALYQTIGSHTTVSYAGLLDLYQTSDVDENGKIWDMYSTKRWNFGETCGNYKLVGDCYNREHSMPKSWFNDASPMYSDAFHIYPTDGKVNGQRSNYPFGECANGTRLASNGSVQALGKLGTCTFSGYTGKVFEPDDQYKGDFARSYFYMAACYNNKIANWKSDMLANNSYPAFTTWAVNLLMKWTRQDEVSEKEIKRNDAVYAKQKNRNPFIDHPELAEHIWGDKKNVAWHSTNTSTPKLTQPAKASTINLGYAAVNVKRSMQVTVKGSNISQNVYLYTSGAGFTVSPSTLTPAQANAGTDVTVSLTSSTPGDAEGELNIVCGDDIDETFDIVCAVENGLPLYDAQDVSSDEFTVKWVYLNDATYYTLNVLQGTSSITGYPKQVNAAAEKYTVTGLDPLTTYTFSLSSGTLKSDSKTVTTADLIPNVLVLYDGELKFSALVGQPSEIAELLLDIENISGDINIAVNAPFQISLDKTNWKQNLTISTDDDRIYMRMLGNDPGTYGTSITITSDGYENDNAEAIGTISQEEETPEFIETFNVSSEVQKKNTPYNLTTFTGTACSWKGSGTGIGADIQDLQMNGTYVIRFSKSGTREIYMNEDKSGGAGTVTFEAAKWGTDATPTLKLEYSLDGGDTWETASTFTLEQSQASEPHFQTFSYMLNEPGYVRLKFSITAGGRALLDNVSISNFKTVAALDRPEYHNWDAFCHDGVLVIESGDEARDVAVYNMEGMEMFHAVVNAGETHLKLQKGLYVVVSNDFSRRVVVR